MGQEALLSLPGPIEIGYDLLEALPIASSAKDEENYIKQLKEKNETLFITLKN